MVGQAVAAGNARVKLGGERRLLGRALARSPWLWITVVVGLSFLVRSVVALTVPGPWILPDELVYIDLARSIADGHLPAVRGTHHTRLGRDLPIDRRAGVGVFGNGLDAYRAALVINAIVMSLAAVPAYLLGCLVVGRRAALLVAAGAVLVPTMALTGSVMTENAAYPLFLTAVWLMARAVRSPTVAAQGILFAVLTLLVLARVQGVALVPAFVAAVVTYAILLDAPARRSYLLRFAPTAIVLGLGILGVATIVAAGWSEKVLAGHSEAGGHLVLAEVPRQFGLQLGGLLVMVAVVPFVASVVMIAVGLSRRADERYRLYASIAWPVIAGTLGLVAIVGTAIVIDGVEGVNERYVFYLAPLLFLGLAAWFEAETRTRTLGVARPDRGGRRCRAAPLRQAPCRRDVLCASLAPWVALPLRGVLAAAVRRVGAVPAGCPLAPARWARCASRDDLDGLVAGAPGGRRCWRLPAARRHRKSDDGGRRADLVDDAVPAGRSVAVLWDRRSAVSAPDPGYFPLMVTAALNDSVGRFLRLGNDTVYEKWLPTRRIGVGRDGTLAYSTGRSRPSAFVLVPCSLGVVAGRSVARAADGGLTLVRTDGKPLRVRARHCAR